MATKSKTEEIIVIKPIETITTEITIIGDTPLIMHAWSEKAKKEMLEAQQGAKKAKKKAYRNPVAEFITSMYWLTPMPEITEDMKETECEEAFNKAIKDGARFCFPVVSIKEAACSAAYRQGYTKSITAPSGAFQVYGIGQHKDMVEIISDPPIMREDMVKIGMGTADLRYRGEFNNWSAKLKIKAIKDGAFNLESIINMINLGGFCCGLGEWRNDRRGVNGAFHVDTQ